MPRYRVMVRGKTSEWGVTVGQEQAEDMREDGFEVYEIVNTIPAWVADLGLARLWAAMEDLWRLPERIGRRRK